MSRDLEGFWQRRQIYRSLVTLFLILYFICLIWVIVFKCNRNASLHIEDNRAKDLWTRFTAKIVPFEYTINAIKRGSVLETLALIFNVVCFMPMTMTFCYLGMRKRNAVIVSVLFSTAIEIYQLFSCWGGFDFMDIVLNGLGGLFGVLIFEFFCIRLNKWVQRTCFLTLFAILIPLDIYAVMNTIQNFPE